MNPLLIWYVLYRKGGMVDRGASCGFWQAAEPVLWVVLIELGLFGLVRILFPGIF